MNDRNNALRKTRAVIEQGMHEGLHPGCQLYASLNGRPVADLALGEARAGVPMRPDSLPLWLSASKPFTAAALALLWEKGRLGLDDAVARHLPEFAAGGKESITLRHLLTHTAGFRGADKVPETLTWDETVRQVCATPAEEGWEPGLKAGYQLFSSWFVLGEVARRVDGRPLGQQLREDLFEPLGMHDSWLGMPPERFHAYGDRMATMHNTLGARSEPHPRWNSEAGCAACRPGSNGRGPVRELARLYESLLGFSPQVLRPATVAQLTMRHRAGLYDHTFQHTVDFGLGFVLNSSRHGEDVPYGYGPHAGEDTFGHSGSQSTCAFADSSCGLAVAWTFNGMPGERQHQRRARALNAALYEDLGLA